MLVNGGLVRKRRGKHEWVCGACGGSSAAATLGEAQLDLDTHMRKEHDRKDYVDDGSSNEGDSDSVGFILNAFPGSFIIEG